MDAGAFMDANVVKASSSFIRLKVDRYWDFKLNMRYFGTSAPGVIFVDSEGRKIGEVQDKSPEGVARKFKEVSDGYAADLKAGRSASASTQPNLDDGVRFIALLYYEPKPGAPTYKDAFADPSLALLVATERIARSERNYDKDSQDVRKFGLKTLPALVLLDLSLDKPEAKPVIKISGPQSAASLKKELEEAIKGAKAQPADTPATAPAEEKKPAAASTEPPPAAPKPQPTPDTVVFKDGTTLKGKVVARAGERIMIRTEDGKSVILDADKVLEVKTGEKPK